MGEAADNTRRGGWSGTVGAIVALLVVFLWAHWSTLVELYCEWQINDNYSVGQLVPLAALYLLWSERDRLRGLRPTTCWWGVLFLLFAQGARTVGMVTLFESGERYAMVLTIVGIVLLVTGWQVTWRLKWLLGFLFLMVPLPGRIHAMISGPLQGQATGGAVFVLELLGVTVDRSGHVIVLNDVTELAVAEACSGLRMLTAFVVVACVLAGVVDRPFWQRCVVVFSSVPIAIVCNIIRLVATAMLFMWFDGELAEKFFHDFAGLTMMPIAVLMIAGELWVLSRLEIVEESAGQPSTAS